MAGGRRQYAPSGGWTEEAVIALIRSLPAESLRYDDAILILGAAVIRAAYRMLGTWRRAVEAAGFKYPGHHIWRAKYYRQDPTRFQAEVGRVPIEKIESTHRFCKEVGLARPVRREARMCRRCKTAFAPIGHTYCENCRKKVEREKARARMKRWLGTPKGQAWMEKFKLQQRLKRIQIKLVQVG